MRTLFFSFLLMLSSLKSISQFAVINDADGYTNMRELPDSSSKVLYKIRQSEVFFYESLKESNSDWVKVYCQKNKYALSSSIDDEYLSGYIHKSRLLPLENLKEYKGNDFTFTYDLEKFNLDNKIIDYTDNRVLNHINGRRIYGTDGNIPKVEVCDIKVIYLKKAIEISNIFFEDVFECDNSFTIKKDKQNFIVYQWNSDGAGGYFIAWVIGEYKLKQRFIFIP